MDPTLWVISAWNDNGFNVNVRDPNRLKRTDFFPGLGWFIPRKLFKGELQKKWPKLHWDHWMRDDEQTKGRDALFPEVPRDYHMGVKGTFMDKKMHNQCVPGACVHVGFATMFPFARVVWYGACGVMRSCVLCRPVQRHPNLTEAWCLARYFAAIEYNQDPKFDWASAEAEQQLRYSVKTEYLARLTADIKRGQHIRSVKELDAVTTGVAVVWCVPQGEVACCHTHLTCYFDCYALGTWPGTKRGWMPSTRCSCTTPRRSSPLPLTSACGTSPNVVRHTHSHALWLSNHRLTRDFVHVCNVRLRSDRISRRRP